MKARKRTAEIDSTRILSRCEIAEVLTTHHRQVYGRRGDVGHPLETHAALVVFRLAACCALRASEIAGLDLVDVRSTIQRPYIDVRADVAKYSHARRVPLNWDRGTLEDLERWRSLRLAHGADAHDPYVCSVRSSSFGRRLTRQQVYRRWQSALRRGLGADRAATCSVHGGRHTCISHQLAAGIPPQSVRRAAGHRSLATTTIYAHLVDDDGIEDLFDPVRLRTRRP